MIQKKIKEIFKDKENRMYRTIEQTIYDDRLKIYKLKKSEYEEELSELEADKKKLLKRKKNKKEKMKLLKKNAKETLYYITKALQATVLHYKELYLENDYYRYKKILDCGEEKASGKNKAQLELLNQFFASPFKDDRRFTICYLAQMTRDRIDKSKPLIDSLFFDKIFNLLL